MIRLYRLPAIILRTGPSVASFPRPPNRPSCEFSSRVRFVGIAVLFDCRLHAGVPGQNVRYLLYIKDFPVVSCVCVTSFIPNYNFWLSRAQQSTI